MVAVSLSCDIYLGIPHVHLTWYGRHRMEGDNLLQLPIFFQFGYLGISWWHHQMETFLCYWSFVWGNPRWAVNSLHKGQWHRALMFYYTPAQRSWRGVYWIHLVRLSVCPSVRPSVCRRHGFRSISQVCFGISISNFICMLLVAIGRSLLIFSDVTFKMAAWRLYWIFWFPDSNFTLALNINFKLQRHNTYVYG